VTHRQLPPAGGDAVTGTAMGARASL